jgi:hypothetical protein
MSAALAAFLADVQANHLTAGQQAAIVSALTVISPEFPDPDEYGNSIPITEESLARLWMAVLYTINGEPIVPPTSLARNFENSPAPVTLSAVAQVIAGVSVTPQQTGKLKVRISGVVQNADTSATIRPVTISVAANGATPALETQQVFHPSAATSQPFGMPFSLVVDLDKASTPTTFPLGTPVTINACAIGDASGELSIPAGALQISVEEAAA